MRIPSFISVLAFASTAVFASEGPVAQFLDRASGKDPVGARVGYEVAQSRDRATSFGNSHYEDASQRLDAGLSVTDRWVAMTDVKYRAITSNARMPLSGRRLPEELWNARVKGIYNSSKVGSSGIGIYFEVGQASDKILHKINDSDYRIVPYFKIGVDPRNCLIGFVDFATLRTYAQSIPMPGIAYQVRLSPIWGASIGYPQSGFWIEPVSWLKFYVRAEPLNFLEVKFENLNERFLDFYLAGESMDEAYRLSTRTSADQKLIYRRVSTQFGTFKQIGIARVQAGISWELFRSYQEVLNYWNERGANEVNIRGGLSTLLSASIGF